MSEAPTDGTTDTVRQVEVVVAVPAEEAFTAFTDEMHRWWVPGPINFFDSARAVTVRCEGGVGGRIVEVYDASSGSGLELGRITAWEPARLLAWDSSIDDVAVAITFDPVEGDRTRVAVELRIPGGGRDGGGTMWGRIVPAWFPAWCKVRTDPVSEPPALSRLAIAVDSARPADAARWLRDVLGLTAVHLPDDDAGAGWVELRASDALVIVRAATASPTPAPATGSMTPWLFVDDLDRHRASAEAAGGDVGEIRQHGYRVYSIPDPDGRTWTIAQALPSVRHDPWSLPIPASA